MNETSQSGTWDDPRLRVYLAPSEIGPNGYPHAWHAGPVKSDGVKHLIRELNDHRCERCHHPFPPGSPGEWSPCDERCTHEGPTRWMTTEGWEEFVGGSPADVFATAGYVGAPIEAQWRILTVHHLNGIKHDLRWWNLAALCQRCHLSVQGRVLMERVHPWDHSEWFKPHAAGWYAYAYLGVDLGRADTLARLDELLNLERMGV